MLLKIKNQNIITMSFVAGIMLFSILTINISAYAESNLVTNGSFEDKSGTCSGGFDTLRSGDTSISGWIVEDRVIDWICDYWESQDGIRSIDVSGNDLGGISQDIVTMSNKLYKVEFWMAENPVGGNEEKSMTVSADSISLDYTFDTTSTSQTDMGWEKKIFYFIAKDDKTTLTFTSNENNWYGPPSMENIGTVELEKGEYFLTLYE